MFWQLVITHKKNVTNTHRKWKIRFIAFCLLFGQWTWVIEAIKKNANRAKITEKKEE